MKTAEEYALWLVESGIRRAIFDDINGGQDPISLRGDGTPDGGGIPDREWEAAMKLTHEIAAAVRNNPQAVLALVGRGDGELPTGTARRGDPVAEWLKRRRDWFERN